MALNRATDLFTFDLEIINQQSKCIIAGNLVLTTDEGLTLETSAFLPFSVANLRFQPSC